MNQLSSNVKESNFSFVAQRNFEEGDRYLMYEKELGFSFSLKNSIWNWRILRGQLSSYTNRIVFERYCRRCVPHWTMKWHFSSNDESSNRAKKKKPWNPFFSLVSHPLQHNHYSCLIMAWPRKIVKWPFCTHVKPKTFTESLKYHYTYKRAILFSIENHHTSIFVDLLI